MRYMALDLGTKRVGLAVGDDVLKIVTPAGVVVTTSMPQRIVLLQKEVDKHGPDALVVGLPLNMDGTEGPAAKQAQALGEALGKALGLPVHFVDERLTSVAADHALARTGLTHKQKKQRHDAQAAAAILRRFLDGT